MSTEITSLRPQAIWKHFHELTQIPRPSRHEEKAVAFAKEFGERLGLETTVDQVGNVIIRKPATKGMENLPGVILQSHLDMVPQKNSDTEHDFLRDPISAYVEGEWVTARGTTLGSDNGIGVSSILAILESEDLKHGPLEALLTIDEETGMTGAFELRPGLLRGKILLNLDSEDEGELYIGCAGGMNTSGRINYTGEKVPAGMKAYTIGVTGLKGGHSGLDINLGRGNSNKLLFRFLYQEGTSHGLRLASVDGGNLRNAIPRESFAVVLVPEAHIGGFLSAVKDFEKTVADELAGAESGISVTAGETELPDKIMEQGVQDKLVRAVNGLPNEVIRMSVDMPEIVETSSNLAIVSVKDSVAEVHCLLRSSVDSAKQNLAGSIQSVLELAGAEVVHDGNYPGWKPDVNSPILKAMKEVYNAKFGKVPEVKVIHAGLECGIIGDAYPGLDMISFGPTIRFPHSPDEKVHIESVMKFWDFLVAVLENIPGK